jgi:hypothetical protein
LPTPFRQTICGIVGGLIVDYHYLEWRGINLITEGQDGAFQ